MLTFLMFGQFFSDFLNVVEAVLPVGISIMGIMFGIKAVPRIIRMFF